LSSERIERLKELYSGNEAIARGAYEAGVLVATGYPGTPSTEILEAVVAYKSDIYCEWSPNEKVAFEVAAGACLTGARSMVTMKHVGLNVAADPLMTLTYVGVEGGFVAIVADDPGMHSSQNEQDTRNYARFAKIPIFEPSDSQEAKDYFKLAMDISEKYLTPVILRTTTRVSHSRSLVELKDRVPGPKPVKFEKNPPRFVPIPAWARPMRVKVEDRLGKLRQEASISSANRIEWRDRSLGIIACGVAYQYVREVFPEASVLKLGWCYPFPEALFREFAAGVTKLLVVEELDDFVEEHIRAMGIECHGRDVVPGIGELSPSAMQIVKAKLENREIPTFGPVPESLTLPPRPPVLCPGCPHRGVFTALTKFDVIVTGDIGCYSLGVAPPLSRMDTILCMGGGFTMAHGMTVAGEKRKVIGMMGDSTFFHSGITGLLDIAYNQGIATIMVLDNRSTAMTGHQDNPGTGKTLMGKEAGVVSIEEIGRACGMKRVFTIDPFNLEETIRVIKDCLDATEPSLIVARGPCLVDTGERVGGVREIDADACRECKLCLKLGCPAMEYTGDGIEVNENLCGGCGLCEQVCKFDAISLYKEAR
jgi:indolepyruvate ferredoxin oxidoreductase alpha subunit